VPLPVPDAPDVTFTPPVSEEAVHAQVGSDAVTLNAPLPPVVGIVAELDDNAKKQLLAGSCVKVNTVPPPPMEETTIDPTRGPPVFVVTL
jgi:hypothetical protein